MCHARGENVRTLLSLCGRELWIWNGGVNTPMCESFVLYKPRSSSAVRESRFTAADLEAREVEGFVVVDSTFCLGPFIWGGRMDGHTARDQLIGSRGKTSHKDAIDFATQRQSNRLFSLRTTPLGQSIFAAPSLGFNQLMTWFQSGHLCHAPASLLKVEHGHCT